MSVPVHLSRSIRLIKIKSELLFLHDAGALSSESFQRILSHLPADKPDLLTSALGAETGFQHAATTVEAKAEGKGIREMVEEKQAATPSITVTKPDESRKAPGRVVEKVKKYGFRPQGK